jgi:hypothetical protein
MKMARRLALTSLCLVTACDKDKGPPPRAELRQVTGNTFELVPAEGQLKYCLVFTRSESGVIRQLTMTHGNRSVQCEARKPIGGVRYRVPLNEGSVKVHVFFSDQPLNAGSLAQDLYERKGDPSFHPIDLRLPGQVFVQTLEFQPQEAAPAMVGGQIGAGGAIIAPADPDAGQGPQPGTTAGTPGGGTPGDAADAGAAAGMTTGVPVGPDGGTR